MREEIPGNKAINFRPFSGPWGLLCASQGGRARLSGTTAAHQILGSPLLCRYSSGLGIAKLEGMLSKLKRRYAMSPLMLMLLLSLVPFPILAIAIVVDRCLKSASKAIS